ncbi:hypothetical protein X777_04631 [Ooceraea biroi]|uniref:DUF4758 domain-containing protein n=1 Tax=Ooceraea biroi TaxID=2015173 RepID=A0A026X3R4_OOCBI|nr:hypothetical protein X777_04631 [Ooceraea biroi]
MEQARTDLPYKGGQKHEDQLLSAINRANIQPSVTEDVEVESSKMSTEPLLMIPDVETGSLKPTGLLKVVDSTTSLDGTTTHYKSHIYGTYIGTNYAQIIHTSSNVYFFPDEATVTYGADDTTVEYGTTGTESDQDTTVEALPSTTPTTITTSEETPFEMNELTTPLKGTTDSVLTTLKDILESARRVLGTTESMMPTLDDEIPNDIVPGDPQGRSIKGGSSQNGLRPIEHKLHEGKATLATRLLPSTVYKTFTYFTTFFIPNGNDQTTTSIRSREVVSSEVTFLTELIRPSATDSIRSTASLPSDTTQKTPNLSSEMEEEQTTKQDEEIELIFKTLYTTYTYLTTFFQENTSSVSSRQVVETNVITQTIGPNGVSAVVAGLFEKDDSTLISPTTISQNVLPSITNARTPEYFNKGNENVPTESITTIDDFETSDGWITDLEPSPTPAMASEAIKEQIKTYYTTYTYFTTIFVDDETEIETRTEVFTNVVTETITPTNVQSIPQETTQAATSKSESAVPPEILAYLEALQLLGSMITDVVSSSSSGGGTVLDVDKRNIVPEDQELSESNNHEVEPAPTLLLQTSYTTFTYFTTMYKGDQTNVASRLETVTNVVTETLKPSPVAPVPTSTLPVTYFTTFTYWTTFYKGGDIITTSREETVSNVVTPGVSPTPTVELDNEVTPLGSGVSEEPVTDNADILSKGIITGSYNQSSINASAISPEPVTFYTTFTYFTTSYIGNETILNSRLETVTSVSTPDVTTQQATGRAIDGPVYPSIQTLATPVLPTGVLSLNKGSVIDADEVTTVYFTTMQIGTLLNGIYAKVIESTSSTKIDEEKKASIVPLQGHRTGLVRLIQGQIENNETTTFYQSKVIGTSIEGRYAQIIESTSSYFVSSPTSIAPTSTLSPSQSTNIPEISPFPAVIQSSLSEEPTTAHEEDEDSEQNEEDDEEGEEGEDQSSKKKSRLTFSTRKRTFTPDIRESPTVYPNFDGTITVTHYVPTEVTIPVVNNGITEHRNIITAQPSTEVLGPSQYSTVTAGDGKPLVVIVSEVTGTNVQGQTEVTRFLLHETPTTRISHTLTSLAGRRVSQSVIVPTTVYSVENIVSTVQPSLPGNAPLANILLSQLLLGQLGPNPLLQPQATPTTQYNTRTTSYVTTITKHQSTVIPLTFRGKEILTTLVDSSTNVVTATEFITDTVVVTPTVAIPAANLNSLLLLLQQPQPQPQNSNPLLDPLFAAAPFTQSNTLPGEVERRHQPADSDYRHDSYEYSEEEYEVEEYQKPSRRSGRGKPNDKKKESKASAASKAESSVVTLYVSGRRPGEFSTVLSTVKVGDSASTSRRRRDVLEAAVEVRPSIAPSLHAREEAVAILTGSEDSIDAHAPTQSLESVVGDVGRHISTSIYT